MTTELNFPVTHDTAVIMKCKDGYSQQSGDKSVTCKGGTNFGFTNKPLCKPGKIYRMVFIKRSGPTRTKISPTQKMVQCKETKMSL